jgi:hypothetical protein
LELEECEDWSVERSVVCELEDCELDWSVEWSVERSVERSVEIWICHYFVYKGAMFASIVLNIRCGCLFSSSFLGLNVIVQIQLYMYLGIPFA